MKKTILFIVPHPDDELSIGGILLPWLKKQGYIIKIMVVTNGDAEYSAVIRLKESIRGLRLLGVKERDVIFLGYGNRWKGGKHIYNQEGDIRMLSLAGKTHTYALKEHQDYHCLKYNVHCEYTRLNMVCDMEQCIKDIWAGIIVCVDFDSHSDHRAVSLMFEEVMENVLHSTSYQPVVLKRFAYAFAWHGNRMSKIMKTGRYKVFDPRFEVDNPYYEWKHRIVINLPENHMREWVLFYQLCLASIAYPSQKAKAHIGNLLKNEMICWQRRTDSILYDAEITVSSGEKKYLTDFKRYDCNDVNSQILGNGFWSTCAWEPENRDLEKTITIRLHEKKYISHISICSSISGESIIENCDIRCGEVVIHTGRIRPGKEKMIGVKLETSVIIIQITDYIGTTPGISEIEAYTTEFQNVDLGLELY